MSGWFDEIYGSESAADCSGAILARSAFADVVLGARSARMLMEQLEYNLLFRWFVVLSASEPLWHPTVFTKNRDRLLEGAVAEEFSP